MGEPKTPERRRHFRGKSRTGRKVRVRYRPRGPGAWIAAETRNIGVGGAFIKAVDLPPGSEIDVEIDLPGRAVPLALMAQVRWRSDGRGEDPPGVGVQFTDVDIDILLDLNSYLASLTGTEPEGVPALLDVDGPGE